MNQVFLIVLRPLVGNRETERVSELQREFGEGDRVLEELIKKQWVNFDENT